MRDGGNTGRVEGGEGEEGKEEGIEMRVTIMSFIQQLGDRSTRKRSATGSSSGY